MAIQQWDAADYAAHARFVSDLAQPVFELLAPQPDEHILDLGCGDGALTERITAAGCTAIGVDSSPAMIAAARSRGLDARVADATALPFEGEFDAVFTNAVLHWIADLRPVLRGVHRALRPHGRFVGECGGHGCVAAVCTALRAVATAHGLAVTLPWNYPTTDDFSAWLIEAGFEPVSVQLVPRPTHLPSGMDAWLRTFAAWVFDGLEEAERERAYSETVDLLRPALCDSQGRWTADYIRLRFAARRM